MADLIIAIIDLGLLYLFLIYSVDFHGFIGTDIPGLILSLMFILLYKELSSFLFFIPLNNLLINPEGKFHYIKYINRLIYSRDLILNIIL